MNQADKKIIFGLLVVYVVGYHVGVKTERKVIRSRINRRTNLMARGITDAILKARQENLSHDEMFKLIDSELDFVAIVG